MPSNARKNTPATPQILGDAMRQGGGGGKVDPPSGGLAASMKQGTSKNGGDAGYQVLGPRMKQGGK